MATTTGSLRGMTIDGVQYRVPGDANINVRFSSFETEALPTSGETVFKMTIITPDIDAVPLSLTPEEAEGLADSAAKTEDYDLSCVLADGTEMKAQGRIHMNEYTSEDGRAEIKAMPNNALKGWQRF